MTNHGSDFVRDPSWLIDGNAGGPKEEPTNHQGKPDVEYLSDNNEEEEDS